MTAQSLSAPLTVSRIASRIAAALLGSYAFSWGFITLSMALLFSLGMEFHDAESLGSILGILLYLASFLWAFSARRLWPVWLVLGGGGGVMTLAAWLLQTRIVA